MLNYNNMEVYKLLVMISIMQRRDDVIVVYSDDIPRAKIMDIHVYKLHPVQEWLYGLSHNGGTVAFLTKLK